jgi:S-DNA-T family DNA segregation ATPase FtsK/SpoIIIE
MAEAGGPWTLALLPGRHLLVSGSTGAGKSGLLWAIVWDLADLIRAGWVTVTAFDPKYVELRDLATTGLGVVHTDVPIMPDELERLVDELDARCARMTTRTHVPSLAEPVRLVVIDELATLTALADTKSRRRVEDALGHLLSRGRAAGFEVMLTSVEATKEVVRWRGLCSTRVCYRTDDDGAADLVLGDGARDRGAATELIPEDTPGVAYTRTEGRSDIIRVRTLQITDRHIAELAHAADGPEPGEHTVIALPTSGEPRSSGRPSRSAS